MRTSGRSRHSLLGRCARRTIHAWYRLANPGSRSVDYRLPGGVDIRLFPAGEIAEFLSFPRSFESAGLALVSAYLKNGMTIVDVGANIGLYSMMADQLVQPAGTVWAFEPSSESFARLEKISPGRGNG